MKKCFLMFEQNLLSLALSIGSMFCTLSQKLRSCFGSIFSPGWTVMVLPFFQYRRNAPIPSLLSCLFTGLCSVVSVCPILRIPELNTEAQACLIRPEERENIIFDLLTSHLLEQPRIFATRTHQ